MLFRSWFQVANRGNKALRRPQRPAVRRFAPRLEALEGRLVLSTLTVVNDFDGGAGSLRQAIADAAPGDTIAFARSVHDIRLTSGELAIAKDLTIQGPGAEKLDVSGSDASRVFDIQSGNVAISGLTISDGRADKNSPAYPSMGGGILIQSSLTLSDVDVTDNQAVGDSSVGPIFVSGYFLTGAALGGGVESLGTSLSITGGTFANNQAIGGDGSVGPEFSASGGFTFPGLALGGALDNFTGTASVSCTQFVANSVQGGSNCTGTFAAIGAGGAVYNDSTLSVNASSFSHNQCIAGDNSLGDLHTGHALGGAITNGSVSALFALRSASLSISNSSLDHNLARGGNNDVAYLAPYVGAIDAPGIGIGGAIGVYQGSINLSGSSIDHNDALGGTGAAGQNGDLGTGGGVMLLNFVGGVTANISNCQINHDSAIGGQGASGANGGDGFGGGLVSASLGAAFGGPGTLLLSSSSLDHNLAQGGLAGSGGDGGNGEGGGLYLDDGSAVTINGGTISYDNATGGKAKPPSDDGQGIGGGIYNAGGVLVISPTTVIAHNDASTEDDNIYP